MVKSFLLYISICLSFGFKSTTIPFDDTSLECDYCKSIVKEIDIILAENSTITDFEEIAVILCELDKAGGQCIPPWDSWQCEQVCKLAVETYESMVDYLLIRYMNPSIICYNIDNNSLNCPEPIPPDPTPVPNIIYDNFTRDEFNNSNKYGYILQIPDVHWDMQYAPNSVANCGEPGIFSICIFLGHS